LTPVFLNKYTNKEFRHGVEIDTYSTESSDGRVNFSRSMIIIQTMSDERSSALITY